MQAIDLLRWAMSFTDAGTARLVDDMRDAPLTQPTWRGGNHPLWAVGHLAFMEGNMRNILTGEPNPVAHWAHLFAPGSQPLADARSYPPFDEVLATFRGLRAQTLALLDAVGDAGLGQKPANVPEVFKDVMTTYGQSLMLLALHNMVHYGQITDARRVAGREPLM